jgi:hypothetical protein
MNKTEDRDSSFGFFNESQVSSITTNVRVVWFHDEMLFETRPGVAFIVKEYMENLVRKVKSENPGQIYMRPSDFQSVRTTPAELMLLIIQGMKKYQDTDDVIVDFFVINDNMALKYYPKDCIITTTTFPQEIPRSTTDSELLRG